MTAERAEFIEPLARSNPVAWSRQFAQLHHQLVGQRGQQHAQLTRCWRRTDARDAVRARANVLRQEGLHGTGEDPLYRNVAVAEGIARRRLSPRQSGHTRRLG